MTFARLGLAVSACSLLSGAAWAGDDAVPAAARQQAIAQMRAWTRLPASAVVAVTPEMVVGLLGRGAPGKARNHIDGVEVQGEVLDEAFAASRGWRSMRLRLDIGCADGDTWVRKMVVYPEHGHVGAGRDAVIPVGWVRPKPEAYLGQVVVAVCGPHAQTDAAITEVLPPATAPTAQQAPARPPPVLRPAIMATAPAEPPPKPPLAPVASTPAPSAPASGGAAVQIAAAPSEGEARHALSRALTGPAASRLVAATPGLIFRVEAADIGGRAVFRALVSGFHDRAAARAWCAALKQTGGTCFVR